MYIACFDVGGTFIKYGVLSTEGEILFKSKIETPNVNCKIAIPLLLERLTTELINEYKISAIGISTAGKVDSEKGEVVFCSNNIPDYSGARLKTYMEESTGLSCSVENDVNVVALAEGWIGAGKGHKNYVCLTLGTGIGGAIVVDGKLYTGVGGGAGEIGHIIINENGSPCGCGSKGCYERYASTSALINIYNTLSKGDRCDSGLDIFKLIKEGNNEAIRAYDIFLKHISTGLVNITHFLDPGLIVIGGGVSEQGLGFIDDIKRSFYNDVMPSYGEYTDIVGAELGNDAGIIGAGYIALNKLGTL